MNQLNKPTYNVEEHYSESGMWQQIARSRLFQTSTLVVIALNVVWIAYETDYNKADVLCNAPLQFQIVDNLFCISFVFEILVRLLAFKNKFNALKDPWWIFDASLVALMVWETWIQVIIYRVMSPPPGSGA